MSVLMIEDDPIDARVVSRQLLEFGEDRFELHHAEDLHTASLATGSRRFDAILLDLGLPDGRGTASVKQVRATAPDTPIICLTGRDDERAALSALRSGAQDYLIKGIYPARSLVNSLRFATERARLHRELEQAHERENSMKEKFLSHVSHEMRTPLTAIIQFVTILRDGIAGALSPEQTRYLDIVYRNGDQLKRMISTLMDATRCTHGKLRCVPARARLEDVLESACTNLRSRAEQKGVTLEHEVAGELPDAIIDGNRIEQVLINLLENAIKFTPAGGTVRAHVGRASDDGVLQVTVDDTGCGIAEDQIDRVFDQLFQAEGHNVSRKGLGLGLHISREIVELHGGSIHAERRATGGTRFVVQLPAYLLGRHVERLLGCVRADRGGGIGVLTLTVRGSRAAARAKGVEQLIVPGSRMLADVLDGSDDCVLPVRRFDRCNLAIVALTPRDRQTSGQLCANLNRQLNSNPMVRNSGAACEVRSFWLPVPAERDPAARIAHVTAEIERRIDGLETEDEP